MKLAKYLPINIGCSNAAIYTATMTFPIKLLREAYSYIMGDMSNLNITLNQGVLTFRTNPEYSWTIPEIVAAYNYYKVAKENDFSFIPIYTADMKQPFALISSMVQGTRFVYLCMTGEALELRRKSYYQLFTQYTTAKCDPVDFYRLFQIIKDMTQHPKTYLDALISGRDQNEECMIMSPYKIKSYNNNTVFETEYYEELISINEENPEGKYFILVEDEIHSKDGCEIYTFDDVEYIKSVHNKVYATKSNYYEIFIESNTDHPRFYVSTDFKHIVDAYSFKYHTPNNAALLEYLYNITNQGIIKDSVAVLIDNILKTNA